MQAFDVIVIGAGLSGLTLAHALARQHITVALIEKNALPILSSEKNTPMKADGRALAMSLSAEKILQDFGLWQNLAATTLPIRAVHVSEQGTFGKVRLSAADMNWPALGHIVPYACLGESILRAVLSSSFITIFTQTEVTSLKEPEKHSREVCARLSSGEKIILSAKLVILAEGNTADIKNAAGFVATDSDREQHVIVADVTTTQAHHNIAYQRFTDRGILAILPRAHNKVTVVWTIENGLAGWHALSDEDWLLRLQQSFGYKLGFFTSVGKKHYYPVKQFSIQTPYQDRLLLLGNAAHTLSPVAAQGFNLTLRDIALLVSRLAKANAAQEDIGNLALLKQYQDARDKDQKTVYYFADKLIEIFSMPYLKTLRSAGLLLFDRLPFVKSILLKRLEGLQA